MTRILKFNEINIFQDDQWDWDEEEKSSSPNFDVEIDELVKRYRGKDYIDILKDFTLNAHTIVGVGDEDAFKIEDLDDNSFHQLYKNNLIGKITYFSGNDIWKNPYGEMYSKVVEVCEAEEIRYGNGGEIDYDNIRLIPIGDFKDFIKQLSTTFITYLSDNILDLWSQLY